MASEKKKKSLLGLLKWTNKGIWSILDQGLFAGSNFLLNIFLARWMTEGEYGLFTIGFSLFLLITIVHTSLIVEPMLVFGPGRFKDRFLPYLKGVTWLHFLLSIGCGLLFLCAATLLPLTQLSIFASTAVAIGVSLPFIFWLRLLRHACYVQLAPHQAAFGGAVYLASMLAGIFLLNQIEVLDSPTAFLLLGGASLVAVLALKRYFKKVEVSLRKKSRESKGEKPKGASESPSPSISREVAFQHWRYGKWALSSGIITWFSGYLYYLLLPLWVSLEATGALKALYNLIMPILHANSALSLILLPALVKRREQKGFVKVIFGVLALFAATTLAYWLGLIYFHRPLTSLLYEGKYDSYSHLLWYLGLFPVGAGISAVLVGVLRSMERPDLAFWAYLVATVISLGLGILWMIWWGVLGAIGGQLLYMVISVLLMAVFLFRPRGVLATRTIQSSLPSINQKEKDQK